MDETRHPENPRRGFLLALSGTLCVGTYFVAGKFAMRGFNLPTFCLIWAAATLAASFAMVGARGKLREARLRGRTLARMIALGAAAGVGTILLYAALRTLDASFAAFVARFQPVMAILLGAVFLRERLRAIELAPLVAMLAGGLLSVWGHWTTAGEGVLVILASFACFAVQHLLAKLESHRVSAEVQMLYRSVMVTAVMTAWAAASGEWRFDAGAEYWAVAIVGAVVSSCLGNMLVFAAFRWWSLSRVVMVTMVQPLAVLPLSWLMLRSLPTSQQLAGGLLILLGAAAMVWIHFFRTRAEATIAEVDG